MKHTFLILLCGAMATPAWAQTCDANGKGACPAPTAQMLRERSVKALEGGHSMANTGLPSVVANNPGQQQLQERTRQALEQAAKAKGAGLPHIDLPAPSVPSKTSAKSSAPDHGFEPERMARQFASARKTQTPSALIFVSLSMPAGSIEKLGTDAKRIGATLVLRGLVGNSLKQTTHALQRYAQTGAEIVIHPEAFKKYKVKVVPSFVFDADSASANPLCSGSTAQQCGADTLIEGDVSLKFALQRMQPKLQGEELARVTGWIQTLDKSGGAS